MVNRYVINIKSCDQQLVQMLVDETYSIFEEDSQRVGTHRWMSQNPEAWREMWEAVGGSTDTEWNSDACLKTWEEVGIDPKETAYLGDNARIL